MERKVLRQRSVDEKAEKAKRRKQLSTKLNKLIKKDEEGLTQEDLDLLTEHDDMVQDIRTRQNKGLEQKDRIKEWEEDIPVLKKKCAKLAEAISRSKRLVVYTGAGISTSANIPDYRGPNGVWTLLDKGKEVAACDLGLAQPTLSHMALFMLHQQGKISHIVSQNCDGLHLRSGMPRNKLSEVHGNMFIEVCKTCKPVRPYVRLFDVTERTNRFRHTTMRRCYICGSGLNDTIVHFGERGSISWPINWNGASKAADKADMILCLGSSLKVLRRYPWLWCMDKPVKQRPPLYIVNLQWTPKDAAATLKLNGRCDFIMSEVLKNLGMKIPEYTPYNDPLLSYATHLNEKEEHTTTRRSLIESKPVGVKHISMEARVSDNGVIKEVRVENKFTWLGNQFESKSCSSSSSESSGSSKGSGGSSSRDSSSSTIGSRSSRHSKNSNNESSNASSSTTSRNSSSSRSSETDEDMKSASTSPTPHQEPSEKPQLAYTEVAPTKTVIESRAVSGSTESVRAESATTETIKPESVTSMCQSNPKVEDLLNGHVTSNLENTKENIKSPIVHSSKITNGLEETNGLHLIKTEFEDISVIQYNGIKENGAHDPVILELVHQKYDAKESQQINGEQKMDLAMNGKTNKADLLASPANKNSDLYNSLSYINGESTNGSQTFSASVVPPTLNGCHVSSKLFESELNLCKATNGTTSHSKLTNIKMPIPYSSLLEICHPNKELTKSSSNHLEEKELGTCKQNKKINAESLCKSTDANSLPVPGDYSFKTKPTKVLESNSTEMNDANKTEINSIINPSNGVVFEHSVKTVGKLNQPACGEQDQTSSSTHSRMTGYQASLVSTPPRGAGSSNFTEIITIKTDEENTSCDNKIQKSMYETGFHSPPYSDHTYASPPHKQQKKEERKSMSPLLNGMENSQSPLRGRETTPSPLINNLATPLLKSNEVKPIFTSKVEYKTMIEVKNEYVSNNIKKEGASNNIKEEVVSDDLKKESPTDNDIEVIEINDDSSDEKAKDEIKIEALKVEVKEEKVEATVKENEKDCGKKTGEDVEPAPRSRRYGLRENRSLKYNGFKEEFLIREQLLQALEEDAEKEKMKHNSTVRKTKVNGMVKNSVIDEVVKGTPGKNETRIRRLEYRTIEWARDALYFSYEPNFLFLEDENGYVCDCCDPKTRRRGGGSSEDNSEAELMELPEDDGSASATEGETSYQEVTQNSSYHEETSVKVHAPGWFGKGRRKRGKTK